MTKLSPGTDTAATRSVGDQPRTTAVYWRVCKSQGARIQVASPSVCTPGDRYRVVGAIYQLKLTLLLVFVRQDPAQHFLARGSRERESATIVKDIGMPPYIDSYATRYHMSRGREDYTAHTG